MKEEVFKTPDGREIKMGDHIKAVKEFANGLVLTVECILNEDTKEYLLSSKVLEKVQEESGIVKYGKLAGERMGFTWEEFEPILDKILAVNPGTVLSIILREIALNFDKKYDNHISESPELWGVSLQNGRVIPIMKELVKSYKTFAAFRTKAEAQEAAKICRNLLRYIFKNGK